MRTAQAAASQSGRARAVRRTRSWKRRTGAMRPRAGRGSLSDGNDVPGRRAWCGESVRERPGVQVRARASEVSRATVMVRASARKNVPVTPVTEMSGRKTTMGVMVEPMRGWVISWRALRTASTRFSPASRCRAMFSTTTMASSMTRPTAAASPPRVMRLKAFVRGPRAR